MIRVALFLLITCSLQAFSIVFIHVGDNPIPAYVSLAVAQARCFNPSCPIYLIASRANLEGWKAEMQARNVTCVSCESLNRSETHRKFLNCTKHSKAMSVFWIWTSERFFYLEELIREKQLTDVFHLENDVMLYVDLEEKLPVFQKHYANMIGATFENDERCVPGFLYISNSVAMEKLIQTFPIQISEKTTDMHTLAHFKDQYLGIWIDFLPVIFPDYIHAADHSLFKGKALKPEQYAQHFSAFGSLFDAAAFGIYLAGWDSQYHAECHPGTISKVCMFNTSHFRIEWDRDHKGRKVPFVCYLDQRIRLNNLHITNKSSISRFCSF